MKQTRGFRFRLEPTHDQSQSLAYLAGGCRYVYNLCLEQRLLCRDELLPTLLDLHEKREDIAQLSREEFIEYKKKEKRRLEQQIKDNLPILHKIRATEQSNQFTILRANVPWLAELPFSPIQNTITQDLDRAYQNFFRRAKSGIKVPGSSKNPLGFPQKRRPAKATIPFKPTDIRIMRESKKINQESTDYFSAIRIPKMSDWINMRQDRPFPADAKIGSARIQREPDGHWYISFVVAEEVDDPIEIANPKTIAIVRANAPYFYQSSHGLQLPNQKEHLKLRENLEKLDRRQAKLERRRKRQKAHSNNWRKNRDLIFKLQNKRTKALDTMRHQITTQLSEKFDSIIIEDYKIAESVTHRQKIHTKKVVEELKRQKQLAWNSFKLQLAYKLEWIGGSLEVLPEDGARRNQCSHCHSSKIHTRQGLMHCDQCGVKLDSAYNQACNLMQDFKRLNPTLSFETTTPIVELIDG